MWNCACTASSMKSWWWTMAAPIPLGNGAAEAQARACRACGRFRTRGEHGFGRAVIYGIDHSRGDAVVIMMADESDDCRDVVRYWKMLGQGWDAVFGSRFVRGGGVIDYPLHKLLINRLANYFLRVLFRVPLNDFTNAFKAYRRRALDGCRPFLSPHFNLTVELPLKIHRSRLFLDHDAHHLAQPPLRHLQAQNQRDGQPVSLYHSVLLAGEVFQPR